MCIYCCWLIFGFLLLFGWFDLFLLFVSCVWVSLFVCGSSVLFSSKESAKWCMMPMKVKLGADEGSELGCGRKARATGLG